MYIKSIYSDRQEHRIKKIQSASVGVEPTTIRPAVRYSEARNLTTGLQRDSVNWVANLTLLIRASKVDFSESFISVWKMWD